MKRAAAVLIGLVVALVAGIGVGATSGPDSTPSGFEWPSSDRIDEAVASLRTDPFYVAPEMRHLLTDEQRSAVSATLRASKEKVHLLYMQTTSDAGYYLEYDLMDRVADQIGPGLYVVVNETMQNTQRDYGTDFGSVSDEGVRARPADGLLAMATNMAAVTVWDRDPEPFDYWGGRGGGIGAGVLFGVGISMGLGLVVFVVSVVRTAMRKGRS